MEENEDFRERLGLNPKSIDDLETFKSYRFIRQQQYRQENHVLLKEVERLEEERIQMKQMVV